jgi:hypothetical protein
MKKIGVLTFHRSLNYGAVFQTYALNKILNNKGYIAEVIDYYSHDVYSFDYKGIFEFEENEKNYLKPLKIVKRLIMLPKTTKKASRFKKFVNNNIKLSTRVNNKKELKLLSEQYDCLITGSDQVWNAKITKEDSNVYNLSYFDNKNKISYSASIGEDNPGKDVIKKLKEEIKDYSFISVREESLKKHLNISKAEVVLDPTLLLKKEDWLAIAKEKPIKEKYIFVYMLEVNKSIINTVNFLSNKLNMGVVTIGSDYKFERELLNDSKVSPEEFLSLMNNAAYVVTNSFHGVCLSIVLNKQFGTILHKTRGSRQRDLLKKLFLDDRIIDDYKKSYAIINNKINYKNVESCLQKERERSLEFLLRSLGK